MKPVLLIVDFQKDFSHASGFYASRHQDRERIKSAGENIRSLMSLSDAVPIIVIYSNYAKDQFGPGLSMCIPGTEGHELDLETEGAHRIFEKNEHSAFSNPDFANFLKEHEFTSIHVAGLLTEYCVIKTAMDSLKLGYETSIIADCTASADENGEKIENAFATFTRSHGNLIDSDQFKVALKTND